MDVKRPSTFDDQLEKIKSRGCIVPDEAYATQVLCRINYYRLTAYFLPFKQKDDCYKFGTNFNTVYKIYEFDRKMRNILFSVIEEIELMLRTQLAYYHAHKYDSLGYLESKNFNKWHNHDLFLKNIERDIKNNRKQPSVEHHIVKYDRKFPVWVIIEYSTMGELSYFYSDLLRKDKKAIATDLFDSTDKNVSSWLMCLTYLRNFCAHYSRLYYYLFPAIPATPEGFPYTLGKRLFDYILVLKFLYKDKLSWKSSFLVQLEALILEYQDSINLVHIGFPENWLELLSK